MAEARKDAVRTELQTRRDTYMKSAQGWKLGYRSLLVGAALLSTGAAVTSKLTFVPIGMGSDISSILAALAAVVTTLIASLDFESNWRVNRRARHLVEMLLIELEKDNVKPDDVATELQKVIKQRIGDLEKGD